MNIYRLKKINKWSLTFSKCFYKIGLFSPGRWLGKIRQYYTLNFLENFAIDKGLFSKDYKYDDLEEVINPPIFIMWYQGEENLPEVIKLCIQSIKKRIKNREIFIVSRDNMKNYVDLPDYIYSHVDSGKITKTFFSDITRAALLYKHGGTWADAAIFLSNDIPEEYFNKIFYCPCGIKSELKKDFRYLFRGSKGWNVSFQGSKYKKFPLYDFIYHFNLSFFETYDTHVDYFQNDFVISIFLKNNHRFREILNNQQENNIYEFELAEMMNKKINKKTLKKMNKIKDTYIHKLTYKKNWVRSKKGKQTVYDYVMFSNNEVYNEH